MQYQAIILAAGTGMRSMLPYNKVLYKIEDKEVIYHAAINFILDDRCDKIFLVCNKKDIADFKNIFLNISKIEYVIGGNTRQESTKKALAFVNFKYVLIHDGARPYVTKDLIDRLIDALKNNSAVLPGLKVTDTVKKVINNKVINTLDRDQLILVQTPQAFETKLIKMAHEMADHNNYSDDASLIELFTKESVFVIDGDINNKKLTIKEDF